MTCHLQMQRDLVESEKELKVLKERVDDLSEENLSLRTKLDELETHCYWLERKERRQVLDSHGFPR